ncbi:stage II sporulation protein M [Clostridium sporogenes]|uniref:stage II sporulation protein M n=1 Tax=Clostridium sporogenes TaxID=1509 RepID=UPI003DA3D379
MIIIFNTNNDITIKNKLKIFLLFVSIVFITYLLNINNAKSNLNYYNNFNNFHVLKQIIIKNTICFIWILSGILIGKLMVYTYILSNGIILGLLISKFKNIKYFLLIIPHGITEIFAFLFTCSIVLSILQNNEFNKKYLKSISFAYIIILISAIIEAFITPLFIKFI